MNPTRVLLADDHVMVRSGLRLVLDRESDLVVAGETGDGRGAVDWVQREAADVVVMDIAMPGLNGIEATKEILRTRPTTAVVILSMHCDETYVLRCLQAGALGYVLKESAESELIAAIRMVRSRKSYFSPKVRRLLQREHVDDLRRSGAEERLERLTLREREVLQLIAEGNTNKEIAAKLFLSVLTVETHRKRILSKLALRGMAELVLYAVRRGVCGPA